MPDPRDTEEFKRRLAELFNPPRAPTQANYEMAGRKPELEAGTATHESAPRTETYAWRYLSPRDQADIRQVQEEEAVKRAAMAPQFMQRADARLQGYGQGIDAFIERLNALKQGEK